MPFRFRSVRAVWFLILTKHRRRRQSHPVSLTSLPNELLFLIAEQAGCLLTISGLIWCNSRLHNLLIGNFYVHVLDQHPAYSQWAGGDNEQERFLKEQKRAIVSMLQGAYPPVPEVVKNRVQALLEPESVLSPKNCILLTDLDAPGNPIREILKSDNASLADMLLTYWICPGCLLPVSASSFQKDCSPTTLSFILKFLIDDHHVDVRLAGEDLRKAISDEEPSLIRFLLEKGVASTFPCPGGGSSWFSGAIRTQNIEVVDLLFEHGLEPSPLDKAFASSCKMESPEIYKAFQEWTEKKKKEDAKLNENLTLE